MRPHFFFFFRSSTQFLCLSPAFHWQDEEEQPYLVDEAGNIEPSQTASGAHPGEESADVWGDGRDDLKYVESLEDFEQKSGHIPDQRLHACVPALDT